MSRRINPFRPNSPINPAMFVGRMPELASLEASLLQTKAGRPKNFMITGERGIGKTSLLDYIGFVARGKIDSDEQTLKFLTISTDIEPGTTQISLIRKIERILQRELAATELARSFVSGAWKFISRVEAGGVKLSRELADDPELVRDDFAYSMAKTVQRVTDSDAKAVFGARYDGVILLLDECDKAASELSLGALLKMLLERVQRQGCNRFMVGLAGLDDLREVLYASHESSLRLFDETKLGRLNEAEIASVVRICLQDAKEVNEVELAFDDAGLEVLSSFSEGYPHFIQQLGYCAFEVDTDGVITAQDVVSGAIGDGGAIALIGDRYYRDDFYRRIQKDAYRKVLRIMSEDLNAWVTKKKIREGFAGKESTLDNAIQALRTRGIIQSKEGKRGVYRLRNKAFALWIKLCTVDPIKLQSSISQNE